MGNLSSLLKEWKCFLSVTSSPDPPAIQSTSQNHLQKWNRICELTWDCFIIGGTFWELTSAKDFPSTAKRSWYCSTARKRHFMGKISALIVFMIRTVINHRKCGVHSARFPQLSPVTTGLKDGGTFFVNCPATDSKQIESYWPSHGRKQFSDKHAKLFEWTWNFLNRELRYSSSY
jgi:hypothetical protein